MLKVQPLLNRSKMLKAAATEQNAKSGKLTCKINGEIQFFFSLAPLAQLQLQLRLQLQLQLTRTWGP